MKYQFKTALKITMTMALMIAVGLSGCKKNEPAAPTHSVGVVGKTTVLASIPDDHKPTSADSAADGKPVFNVIFNENGSGVAYIARIGNSYHVVYNGKVGLPTDGIDIISISADGKRIAYSAQIDGRWGMFIDGQKGVDSDEVGDPVFSPDGKHIAYWGKLADKWFMCVDGVKVERERSFVGDPVFNADSSRIMYMEQVDDTGAARFVIRDLALKELYSMPGHIWNFILSPDKSRIAAVLGVDGKMRVAEFDVTKPSDVMEGPLFDGITDVVFSRNSSGVAYIANLDGKRFVVLNGKQEELPKGELASSILVRPDNKAVGMLMADSDGAYLHQAFAGGSESGVRYGEAGFLAYSDSSGIYSYAARKGDGWFIISNGKEGESFDRVVTPVFSPDGTKLVYRVRHEGKRFVVVADADGDIIKRHPEYEMVFAPVFTSDGKRVAYGVKEGRDLVWKVEALN